MQRLTKRYPSGTITLVAEQFEVSQETIDGMINAEPVLKKVVERLFEYENFKPQDGERFYYIDLNGIVKIDAFGKDAYSMAMYLMGNCFRTKKEAVSHRNEIISKYKEDLG